MWSENLKTSQKKAMLRSALLTESHTMRRISSNCDMSTAIIPGLWNPYLELVWLDFSVIRNPGYSRLERFSPVVHAISESLEPVSNILFILFGRNWPRCQDVEYPCLRSLEVGLIK